MVPLIGGPATISLLQRSPAEQSRHEESLRQREARLKRRDDAHQQQMAAAAHDPRPSEVLRQAERDMRPGSYAARAEQREIQFRQHASERAAGFRQAMTHAAEPTANGRDAGRGVVGDERPAVPFAASSKSGLVSQAQGSRGRHAASERINTHGISGGPTQSPSIVTLNGTRVVPQVLLAAGALSSNTGPHSVSGTAAVGGASTGAASAAATGKAGVPPVAGAAQGTSVAASNVSHSLAAARGVGVLPVSGVAAVSSTPNGTARNAAGTTLALQQTAEPTGRSDANIERILRLVCSRIGQDRSVATLRLDPPELGTVRVHMDLRHENLGLRVETQTPAAQRLLSDHIETLRQGLEATGIQLDRIEVRAPAAVDGTEPRSQSPDVPLGDGHTATPRDTHSAGGGGRGGTESPPGEWSEEESPATGRWWTAEPAAESLVNIWA